MRWFAMPPAKLARTVAMVAASALTTGCALLAPLPRASDLDQRLRAFPTAGLPLERPVAVYWNDHQVPYIVAETDRDLAVALGLVHAHLRLGQMEVMRRISQGRLAEMGGPIAASIDHSLRILNYRKAIPATIAALPPATREWLEAFVAGVNHYAATTRALPHEFRLLGLSREPWTVGDLLTIGRLASTDVNWLVWFRVLRLRDRADWPALWARLVARGSASVPSFDATATADATALSDILSGLSKSGSNSVAVAGTRTTTGAAMIANDPHLGVSLPNLWLIVGVKSPSYNAVGLMIPGLPFFGLGRNPRIAWGGTNMRAASSDLVDVSGLASDEITVRRERIDVRWWPDRTVEVRETPYGPVITDAPSLDSGANGAMLALRWAGHTVSDEVTAMLAVARATGWQAFRDALAGFHVPGQNMLYADADGHIGQVMAVRLPRRPGPPDDIAIDPARAAWWEATVTAAELPARFDPPTGYLASANNRPAPSDVPVGWFFSPDDRIVRLNELLAGNDPVTFDDLAALQRDVYMHSAVAVRDALAAHLPDDGDSAAGRLARLVRDWDGHYDEDSAGALAYELLIYHFVENFYAPDERRALDTIDRLEVELVDDLVAAEGARIKMALAAALAAAVDGHGEFGTWGAMHRMTLVHPLSFIPLIGGRYRFGDYPTGGASTTLMKTAAGRSAERHRTGYGSQSRHISDMADPDANWFVLLGGQDGWFNSSTFIDQYALWRRGDYIQVPLQPAVAREKFRHRMTLAP